MPYEPEDIRQLEEGYQQAFSELTKLRVQVFAKFGTLLTNDKAKEYLFHGVSRRLRVLQRSLENVFRIFPIERTTKLGVDERADIQINLHAFVINIIGVLDNIAWVHVFEQSLEKTIERNNVDLFKVETQAYLPQHFRSYLQSERTKTWHKQYAKDFRDALAHRIPLYVPPSVMTAEELKRDQDIDREKFQAILNQDFQLHEELSQEQEALGSVCAAFAHSFWDSGASKPVQLHPQLIADVNTIIELTRGFIQSFPPRQDKPS